MKYVYIFYICVCILYIVCYYYRVDSCVDPPPTDCSEADVEVQACKMDDQDHSDDSNKSKDKRKPKWMKLGPNIK